MNGKARKPLGVLAATLVGASAWLAAASPASASDQLQSFMMDDDLLVYSSAATRLSTLDLMKRSGVDGVRVTMSWKFVSGEENGRPRRKPARFRGRGAENPGNYRADIWDRFDEIVGIARDRGMEVMLNVTGPGPVWAHPRAPFANRFDQPAWRPRVGEFRKFVKAVARRYSGVYPDENNDHRPLPRVRIWSIYNEVNQPASLAPQLAFSRVAGRVIPVAPILYRELYYAATNALRTTGHGRDTILMGETAPLGGIRNTPRIHLWPKQFLREMLCLTPSLRPYTGRQARARKCDELRRGGPFLVSGYAHHPYSQRNPPTRPDRNRDSINLGNIGELPVYLDRLAARTGLIPQGLPVALTEHGWETLPPDPTRGVSLERQAEYLNVAQHIAYANPRIMLETQFVLRDVPPRREYRGRRNRLSQYWGTWQSGLFFADGSPKPAYAAYQMPFDATVGPALPGGGREVGLWGQLRFLPNGGQSEVRFQFRPQGSQTWTDAGPPLQVTNPFGYYDTTRSAPGPGTWRAFAFQGSEALFSREDIVAF